MNNDIYIFSHNYLVGDWETIVKDQLGLLLTSKLYGNSTKIYYCVFCYEENAYKKFLNLVVQHDPLNKIEIIRHEENKFELSTLKLLQKKANECQEEAFFLYFHTKGLTTVKNHRYLGLPDSDLLKNAISWRKCLEYFNIEKWKTCVEVLPDYDVVGAMYVCNGGPIYNNFYSGNFWWSKTSYLNKLPIIDVDSERIEAEIWIGKSPHSWFNFYSATAGNAYLHYYDPQEYKK